MADELMYIPNEDTQNSLFCRLQVLVETFGQASLKVPKVVKPTNKKTLLKTLGTSVINSPLSPFFLILSRWICGPYRL